MAHASSSSFPAASAMVAEVATVHRVHVRAKRVGGPIRATSFAYSKLVVASILRCAIEEHASQRQVAAAAGVSRRLVQQWTSPEGSNGLRLDVAVALAADGGPACRNLVRDALRAVLQVIDTSSADND
jgi:hypothetical protein